MLPGEQIEVRELAGRAGERGVADPGRASCSAAGARAIAELETALGAEGDGTDVAARPAAAAARPPQAGHRGVGALGGAAGAVVLRPGRPALRGRPGARPAAVRRRRARPRPAAGAAVAARATRPAAAAPATSPRARSTRSSGRSAGSRACSTPRRPRAAPTPRRSSRSLERGPAQRPPSRPRGLRARLRDPGPRGVAVGRRRARSRAATRGARGRAGSRS